jgi:hypothetical protein
MEAATIKLGVAGKANSYQKEDDAAAKAEHAAWKAQVLARRCFPAVNGKPPDVLTCISFSPILPPGVMGFYA